MFYKADTGGFFYVIEKLTKWSEHYIKFYNIFTIDHKEFFFKKYPPVGAF